MKTFHFLSGLPRSGSTVLSKIICQHPEMFCSSTSPLLEYMTPAAMQLHQIKNTHSYGHIVDIPLILNQTANSFFSFTRKPIIIDKNRGWITSYEAINQDFTRDPKFIITLRPIDEVITSFYHILQKNGKPATPSQVYEGWVKGIQGQLMEFSKYKDRVCVVTYQDITKNPARTMKKIEKYLDLYHHEYDFNNIQDTSPEDDQKWGLEGLHTIRSTISVDRKDPAAIMNINQLEFCKQETKRLYNAFGLEV